MITKKPKVKSKTLRRLVDDLAVLLQRHVRLKSQVNGWCICCSCGQAGRWDEMDGGHFISRNHQGTKVMEENIHAQCKGCNLMSGKGDSLVTLNYTEFMVDMYGPDFVEDLKILASRPATHFRPDVQDEIKRISHLNKQMEAEIG